MKYYRTIAGNASDSYCTQTGKVMFATESIAISCMGVINRYQTTTKLKSAYKCKHCKQYHLTTHDE
jgi:hypothetical protein